MFSKSKQLLAIAALSLLGSSAFAYIQEGFWTDGYSYFYVNSKQHYCTSGYKPEAQRLSSWQRQELQSYSYDGECENYGKGPKNYQGRSYYFNGVGAYCQYRYYKSNLPEMSSWQASELFRSNHFDGTCVE